MANGLKIIVDNFNSETIIPNPIHEQSLLSSKKTINHINIINI